MDEILAEFDDVSITQAGRVLLDRFSFRLTRGSALALIGREPDALAAVVDALLGKVKASSGRILLFGRDPRRWPRRWRRRLAVAGTEPDSLLEALADGGELLVLSEARLPDGDPGLVTLRQRLADSSASVLMTASNPREVERVAGRVGIVKAGRLRFELEVSRIPAEVRRIKYRNELTEGRSDYGKELDEFDAIAVRVRGWGIEAIVRDYSEEKFDRLRRRDGVLDASAEPVSLEELFSAVAGPVAEPPAM